MGSPLEGEVQPLMVMKRLTMAIFRCHLTRVVLPPTIGLTIGASIFASFFGLIARFIPNTTVFYLFNRELLPLLGALMLCSFFVAFIRLEKAGRTAELLFSTPLSVKAYMFSLWLAWILGCIIVIYPAIGAFVFVAGIERMAGVSLLFWIQPFPLAITWVSAGGLLAITLMLESSLRKKIVYAFIVFIPLLILMAGAIISIIITSLGTMAPELLPASVLEVVPPFMHCHGARWLPAAIYASGCFFLLIRRIHVGNFIFADRLSLLQRMFQRIQRIFAAQEFQSAECDRQID